MKIILTVIETFLLFIALAFTIPIPNSTPELYAAFPSIAFASIAFLLSRVIRHGAVEHRFSKAGLIGVAYAAFETLLFAEFFVILHRAAEMFA